MPARRIRRKTKPRKPATLGVHVAEGSHGVGGPVHPPVTLASTFIFSSAEEMKRWAEGRSQADVYTRYGNPTLRVAEAKIAALEGTEAALVTASGMAAISTTLLTFLNSGDEIIATRSLYGGTYRLLRDVLPRFGIQTHFVDGGFAGAGEHVSPRTRVLYTESPTNPTLRLVDLPKAAAFARRHKLLSLVDNTFATPIFQRPFSFGFDLVLHSATKYLGGHADLIAGAVAGRKKHIDMVRKGIIALGGSLDPGAAYLLTRGIRTLEMRVRHQAASALQIARFLDAHPKVVRVHYPGLSTHPDHRLARRQMDGFGSMMAFDLKGGLAAARRFCNRIRVIRLAASLGGVESLAILPIYTSHHGMTDRELKDAGVSPGTVRLSVGAESPEDLIEDLKQALG